ncbi:MAG: hypothetical protein JRI23_32180, partial [Deltaproteobacteria bacterium]|jgi:hypothetical protein|nr:hypothetical protein [Deltaproteobacteria bacterium]MBW2536892.1 hypothetical protein [Deltaproteobacteria bacterium]
VLVQALTEGDVETLLEMAPSCTWASGASWTEGLDAAVRHFAERSSQELADYHVCNNDAVIQAEMWETFAATGAVPACNTTSAACAGPQWLYAP